MIYVNPFSVDFFYFRLVIFVVLAPLGFISIHLRTVTGHSRFVVLENFVIISFKNFQYFLFNNLGTFIIYSIPFKVSTVILLKHFYYLKFEH